MANKGHCNMEWWRQLTSLRYARK